MAPLTNQELGKILVAQSYLAEDELKEVLHEAEERRIDIRNILFERRLLTSELLENALAEYFKLPFYDLIGKAPSRDIVAVLPEDFARTVSAIAVAYTPEKEITVTTSDPTYEGLEEAVKTNVGQLTYIPTGKAAAKAGGKSFWGKDSKKVVKKFSGKVTFVYSPKSAIATAFALYHKPLATRFQSIMEKQKKVAPEMLEEIFEDAMGLKASDIHFEPQEKDVIVRFRVDGVMHEAGRLPKAFYEGIINRIKIEANLRIDEHFAAQDGAIRYKSR